MRAILRARVASLSWLAEPREVRERWLGALSRAVDAGLRSPVFLICMRYGLALTVEAQALGAEALGQRAPLGGARRR